MTSCIAKTTIKSPTKFIEFNSRTTFNEIRTEFPKIPYLLQSPEEDNATCDFFNKDSPEKNFTQIKQNTSDIYSTNTSTKVK